MGEQDPATPESAEQETGRAPENQPLIEAVAEFLASDDAAKPEWQLLNQQILTTQSLQHEFNTRAHNLSYSQRLRARYDRAEHLLRALNVMLGFDPDNPRLPDPQAYLRDRLNHALADFGLEVTLRK